LLEECTKLVSALTYGVIANVVDFVVVTPRGTSRGLFYSVDTLAQRLPCVAEQPTKSMSRVTITGGQCVAEARID
jgi:hypothetical protein